jgi:L-ribulose-5-phosphate 3-epimerase
MNRRQFIKTSALAALATGGLTACQSMKGPEPVVLDGPLYRISLDEGSLRRALQKGELTHLDFPVVARRDYQVEGVEYASQFFKDKARDRAYLNELRNKCDGEGVTSVLIRCDDEGRIGDPDNAARTEAVENHRKWLDAAKFLGCHSVRVNAYSSGAREEQARLVADGLRRVCELARPLGLNVLLENRGGYSSNGKWMASVIQSTGLPNAGTLPDFGNFTDYDRYVGVQEMLPYAKGLAAQSHDFDYDGKEKRIDFSNMLAMAYRSGYRGWVGIAYQGEVIGEPAGIRLTKKLLERIRDEITSSLLNGTFL